MLASPLNAIAGDQAVLAQIRGSLSYARELVAALSGTPLTPLGAPRETPWRAKPETVAVALAGLRGRGEEPSILSRGVVPGLLIRNTDTAIEDDLNRLGWGVW